MSIKVSTVYKRSWQDFQGLVRMHDKQNKHKMYVCISSMKAGSSSLPFGRLLAGCHSSSGLTPPAGITLNRSSSGHTVSCPAHFPSSVQLIYLLSASYLVNELQFVHWCWSDKQSCDFGKRWPWEVLVLCGNKWLCANRLLSRTSVVL